MQGINFNIDTPDQKKHNNIEVPEYGSTNIKAKQDFSISDNHYYNKDAPSSFSYS